MPKSRDPPEGGPYPVLPRWFRALFAWKDVAKGGVWIYSENTLTGQRKAYKHGSGWQPVSDFIRDGDVVVDERGKTLIGGLPEHPSGCDLFHPAPPSGGSGVQRPPPAHD